MRWSRAFIPTLRDTPSDANSLAQKLLIRGGFLRLFASGDRSYLPLGQRTLLRILNLIREEWNAAGAQEFHLPTLPSVDLREKTGDRIDAGKNQEGGHSTPCRCLAPKDVFAEIARKEIRSYKDLPQTWYQIQVKLHDEGSGKSDLMRRQQSMVLNSCSFDINRAGLDSGYRLHHDLHCRIFSRCGLEFIAVNAGAGGEGQAQEFMVRTDTGGDSILSCSCGYAAKLACAQSKTPKMIDAPAAGKPQLIHTPGQKTIAEIAAFLRVPPTHQIKSLVYMIAERPHLFLLRGDHPLSEDKMMAVVGTVQVRPAQSEEIRAAFGAEAGSLGPVGITGMPVIADFALRDRQNLTCGANQSDYHLQGITPEVHFQPIWADLRLAEAGEACVQCGRPLDTFQAVQVGRISNPGPRDAENTNLTVLTADGKPTPLAVGSYEIAIENLMTAVIESHHDEDGMIWPAAIAPFQIVLTPIQYKNEVQTGTDQLYEKLRAAGMDALLDDRAERPGVKFKDADLIGIPYRIVLGPEKLKQGKVELFDRATRKTELVDYSSVVSILRGKLMNREPGFQR